jgi:hypothetical protein
MFGQKNGAAQPQQPGGAAIPSGVQMFLRSLGFDPVALFQQIGAMMQEVAAARLDFTQRLDHLRTAGIAQANVMQQDLELRNASERRILAAIGELHAEQRRIEDMYIELMAAIAGQLEEVKKWQTEQKPRRK